MKPIKWYPLLPFALALVAALCSTLGGSALHNAAQLHRVTTGRVGFSAAQQADEIGRALWWFGAAAALLWTAFVPLTWPFPWPRRRRVAPLILLVQFLVGAALLAYFAGDHPGNVPLQVLWLTYYLALPALVFIMTFPFLFIATGRLSVDLRANTSAAANPAHNEGDA